jgi:hypothetical protein
MQHTKGLRAQSMIRTVAIMPAATQAAQAALLQRLTAALSKSVAGIRAASVSLRVQVIKRITLQYVLN